MDSPKYNRTYHFHFSPGALNDDKISVSMDRLIGVPIIISEKMDGSNTSLEADGCFARTHANVPAHASFDGLKSLHATVKSLIPNDMQLFGEWLWAKHSIAYNELPGYFLMFNVRDLSNNMWLSWEEVEMWAKEIGVPTVPVLYRGKISSEAELRELVDSLMLEPSCCGGQREGVVVRIAAEFADADFADCVHKNVRADHIQTDEHWKNQEIVRNKLKAP